MPRDDWRELEEERRRAALRDRDAYGRSDYSGDPGRYGQPRSWEETPAPRRRGPSDRVLWAVIVERLEDERGLDLRDVEVFVQDGEVTLNGHVRRRADKRRIEDLAEIDGVRHVQNNLRADEHRHWTFF